MIGQTHNPFNLMHGGRVDPRLGPPGVDTIPAVADGTPIKLTGGEYVLPEDTTQVLSPELLDQLVAATHRPVQPAPQMPPVPGFADGGFLAGLFRGVPRDRAAQIDAAVNGAPPVQAPLAPPVQEPPPPAVNLADVMREIRAANPGPGYADGGFIPRRTAAVENPFAAYKALKQEFQRQRLGALSGSLLGGPATVGAQLMLESPVAAAPDVPAYVPGPRVMGRDQHYDAVRRSVDAGATPGYADGGQVQSYYDVAAPRSTRPGDFGSILDRLGL